MSRMTLALVALLGCCAGAARADTLPSYSGISNTSTYTPGTSFSFELLVPQLGDFTNYTVELILHTQVQNPALKASVTVAPIGNYVFPTNANFHLVPGSDNSLNDVDLAFADSTSPGVITTPGTNDTLATITVTPDASFSGPITISLGAETSFSYDLELGSIPQPRPITITQAAGGTSPVPGPSGMVLLGIGGLLLAGRGRLLKRRQTVQNAC